jgi:hypothetical protein
MNLSRKVDLKLSGPSGRKLTIAKELYLHGYFHSMRRSVSDVILSILNFDFCAETIVKTVLLDHGVSIERQRGGFKTFDELISDLQRSFPSLRYVDEVVSLHKLRNDVQHHSNIPSEQEVSRHKTTIRLFFDEVCQIVYDSGISYDDISLALFIKSENEKTILGEMEKAFQKGSYSDCIYYGKQAAIYHVMLLRSNMGVPDVRSFHNPFTFSDFRDLREVGDVLEKTTERLNWAVDRLCLREHYDEMNQLLGGRITSPYFYWYRGDIQRVEATQNEAEQTRNLVYEFVTSTQDLTKEQDLKSPFVFDLVVKKAELNEDYVIQVGFVSTSTIASVQLTIRKMPSQDETKKNIALKEEILDISKDLGLHIVPIQTLEKGRQYQISCRVTDEKKESDSTHLTFKA